MPIDPIPAALDAQLAALARATVAEANTPVRYSFTVTDFSHLFNAVSRRTEQLHK